jgi:hypothetical protein
MRCSPVAADPRVRFSRGQQVTVGRHGGLHLRMRRTAQKKLGLPPPFEYSFRSLPVCYTRPTTEDGTASTKACAGNASSQGRSPSTESDLDERTGISLPSGWVKAKRCVVHHDWPSLPGNRSKVRHPVRWRIRVVPRGGPSSLRGAFLLPVLSGSWLCNEQNSNRS